MSSPYTTTPYTTSLGPLGHITGLTLTPSSSSTPHSHYIAALPYALPPTQSHRFRPPRPLPPSHSYGTRTHPGNHTQRHTISPQPGFNAPPAPSRWSEDCLSLDVWIPGDESQKPARGWPVLFFVHGGWLQFGEPSARDVGAKLLGETGLGAVLVMPAYRLNAFGFLAGRELVREGEMVGNMGFWDQRCALEWTHRWVAWLGGDRGRVTVAGYSAGAHSAFQQLAFDLRRPRSEMIVGRCVMWSNGPGVRAKGLEEHQVQFDEFVGRLGVGAGASGKEKLRRLREASMEELVAAQDGMKVSEFRALADGVFVNDKTMDEINDGTFARKLKERGIKILNGETSEEWNMYGSWRPPVDSYGGLYQRLVADYSEKVVRKLMPLYFPKKELTDKYKDWRDAFGKVYADMQVYMLERGFADKLAAGGLTVGKDLLRYRIEWRAKCVDAVLPPEWGVTHATDMAIWFWGNGMGDGLTEAEKEIVKPLNKMLADFVAFKDVQWPVKDKRQRMRLRSDGKMDMVGDDRWDEGLAIWKAVNGESSKVKAKASI